MVGRQQVLLTVQPHGNRSFQATVPLEKDSFVIGRNRGSGRNAADLVIADEHVSRRHCAILWDTTQGWMVSDLNSTNGTQVNGREVHQPMPLKAGSRLLIGTTLIVADLREPTASDPQLTLAAPHMAARPMDEAVFVTMTGDSTLTAVFSAMPSSGETSRDGSGTATAEPRSQVTQSEPDATVTVFSPEDNPAATVPSDSAADPARVAEVSSWGGAAAVRAQSQSAAPPSCEEIPVPRLLMQLVEANLMDIHKAEMLVAFARHSGTTVFRALAQDASIHFKDQIFSLLARNGGVPYIPNEVELRDLVQDVPWLQLGTAQTLGALPMISTTPGEIRYATIDPFDLVLRDWILGMARQADPEIEWARPVLTTVETLTTSVQRLRSLAEHENADEIGVAIDISIEEEREMATQLDGLDVPMIVNFFIHRAFTQGASDIHIEPTEAALLVRNRVDGILHEDSTLAMAIHPEVSSRIKIMSGMDVAEKRRPQDGRLSVIVRGSQLDVRVSTYPTVYGEKVVMRLLDKNALRPSVQGLGLLPKDLRLLKDKVNAPFGLIMISGPTGSGKTTTLYSCLGSIDKRAKNVLTVEDPVEYRLAGVHQMQVNDKIGLTFASGLRTILRQDPDVIMVGECRDVETAAMAIQASLTGHIVFSTIHTNDAIGVVTRLLDMKIDPFLVANAVSVAVAQRLVRRICPNCRTEILGSKVLLGLHADGVSDERLAKLGLEIDPEIAYVHGVGCLHCRNTGYQGRQPVFEMFEMTGEARTLVMSPHFNADDLRAVARRNGMMTLIEHGLRLVEEGITTHEEVIRVLGESA
ncbi:MAG: ATPase, T2SS/T4P/T4SS family [Alphaproteobacteria bacterium]